MISGYCLSLPPTSPSSHPTYESLFSHRGMDDIYFGLTSRRNGLDVFEQSNPTTRTVYWRFCPAFIHTCTHNFTKGLLRTIILIIFQIKFFQYVTHHRIMLDCVFCLTIEHRNSSFTYHRPFYFITTTQVFHAANND